MLGLVDNEHVYKHLRHIDELAVTAQQVASVAQLFRARNRRAAGSIPARVSYRELHISSQPFLKCNSLHCQQS